MVSPGVTPSPVARRRRRRRVAPDRHHAAGDLQHRILAGPLVDVAWRGAGGHGRPQRR